MQWAGIKSISKGFFSLSHIKEKQISQFCSRFKMWSLWYMIVLSKCINKPFSYEAEYIGINQNRRG